jgi:predicted O-linked N-acetylglucosamine transferase (SPINDLY family)
MLFALNYVAEVGPVTATNEAKRFGDLARRQVPWRYEAWQARRAGEKIRVGFVSGDLREHPVGYFIEALLRHLDPKRFELLAYHATMREDQLTGRLKPFFKQWRCVHGMNDENLAKRIHADGVNLLFDLSGHTGNSRLSMFAFKPAPVQVAYLGYFATTGLAEIDYILGDQFVTPHRDAVHFTEEIWQLPHSYWCYTPPSADVAVGPLPALCNGHVTFGCFNNTSKLNARVFDTWAEVMQLVPDSRLLLKAKQLDDKALCNKLHQEFAARGIDLSRIELDGWSGYTDYLKAYQRVDIGLDPFPFPGGTTTMDSLWMGVPVVAIQGDRLVGHNAETVAHNAGLGDWVSATTQEYVAKAVSWSGRLDELSNLRAGMRERLKASPLMDGPLFAQSVGDAIEGMCAANPFTCGDAKP